MDVDRRRSLSLTKDGGESIVRLSVAESRGQSRLGVRGKKGEDGPCGWNSWVTNGEIVESCFRVHGEEGTEAEE